MQSALAVTKEMSAQKIPRNTFVYNILVDGYGLLYIFMSTNILQIITFICLHSTVLSKFGFQIFMQIYLIFSNRVFSLSFDSFLCLLTCPVSADLVFTHWSRWARRGDVWEAADLMQQMKREGVQPDIHSYTSFINACCKAGDMQVPALVISYIFLLYC